MVRAVAFQGPLKPCAYDVALALRLSGPIRVVMIRSQ